MSDSSARPMRFPMGKVRLHGNLSLPDDAEGLVVFVHGSGSSRHSPRNKRVADFFNGLGLATLLFDLLTEKEQAVDEQTRQFRFDIPLLSERLNGVVDQLRSDPSLRGFHLGLFGASTGAAAALITAASRPADISAVVSRGGRVDLAGDSLDRVKAPTLFIVGGADLEVLELNRQAITRLQCAHELSVVPGATHLFEEAGKMDEVAGKAADWFRLHLVGQGTGLQG